MQTHHLCKVYRVGLRDADVLSFESFCLGCSGNRPDSASHLGYFAWISIDSAKVLNHSSF